MLDIPFSVKCLLKKDSTLKDLFYDPPIENLHAESNYFQSIVRSIVYQQLSGKAARKIHERFINIFKLDSNVVYDHINGSYKKNIIIG